MSGHFRKKALGFVLLIGAGMLLGMQLAGSGLRSVYGPEWEGDPVQSVNQQNVENGQMVIEDTPAANAQAYDHTYNNRPYNTSRNVEMKPQTRINEADASEQNENWNARGEREWDTTAIAQDANTRQSLETPRELLGVKAQPASVDTMADKTAGMLQSLSRKGIRWVVSVFDGVTE